MSAADITFADMHDVLFNELGEDATVQRGGDAPVPVRVFVERGIEILGDYGRVVSRVTKASFINSEWQPQQGDVLTLSSGARKVDTIDTDDGFVTRVVLHG